MGVHDIEKYDEIKALLNIPKDEPIFIIRAKDRLSFQTIMNYQSMAVSRNLPATFVEDLERVLDDFSAWQDNNQTKLPD